MKAIKTIAAAAMLTFAAVPAVAVSPGIDTIINMYSDWAQQDLIGQFIYYCDGTATHWGGLSANQTIDYVGDC